METRNYRGDEPVADQLLRRFGITAWEWTRLKLVFEAFRVGDEFASDLIERTNAGDLTYSGAYRLLRSRDADAEIVGSMRSVNLAELYHRVIGAESFFTTIEVALRRGLSTRDTGLTPQEIEELPVIARSASARLKKIATHLASQTTGGPNTDGSTESSSKAQQEQQ